jgi:hypothetical protein
VTAALLEGVPLREPWCAEPTEEQPEDAFLEVLSLEEAAVTDYATRSQGFCVLVDLLRNKGVKRLVFLVVKDRHFQSWELARMAIPLGDNDSIEGILGTASEWLHHRQGEEVLHLYAALPGWSVWE